MATSTRIKPGKSIFTADDVSGGTIEKVTKLYAYSNSGERFRLDSFNEAWTVL